MTETQKLRGRPVMHEEALAAVGAYVNSLPALSLLNDYIHEQEFRHRPKPPKPLQTPDIPGEPVTIRADIVRNEHSGYIHMRVKNGETGANYDFILPEWAVMQPLIDSQNHAQKP